MRIHYLQHVHFEDLAMIADWAALRGHSVSGTRLYAGEDLPRPYEVDWIVVMGGPMNIYEEDVYPWLEMEKNFIGECIDRGVKTLGICLGAQLIADVLGGRVTQNPHKEIGWFPVHSTADAAASPFFAHIPGTFDALHWHGDTFSLPRGCKPLAASEACPNQAFSFEEHVLGLQFHLEFTPERLEGILQHCAHELKDAPYVQDADSIRAVSAEKLPMANGIMLSILDVMEKL